MYDIERLIDEADSLTVAKWIGMDVHKKGNRYCIPCPGHVHRLGKVDRTIGNCVLTPKGYHCFACDAKVGLVSMVIEFTGCSYVEALKTIGDACGGADAFEINGRKTKTRTILSSEDLAIIGLAPSSNGRIKCVVNADNSMPKKTGDCFSEKIDDEFIVYRRQDSTNLSQMNEKTYRNLIYRKARNAVKEYEEAIKNFCSRSAPNAKRVCELTCDDEGYIDSRVFTSLKSTLQNRLWRAEEICEEFKDRQK